MRRVKLQQLTRQKLQQFAQTCWKLVYEWLWRWHLPVIDAINEQVENCMILYSMYAWQAHYFAVFIYQVFPYCMNLFFCSPFRIKVWRRNFLLRTVHMKENWKYLIDSALRLQRILQLSTIKPTMCSLHKARISHYFQDCHIHHFILNNNNMGPLLKLTKTQYELYKIGIRDPWRTILKILLNENFP